MIYYLSTTSQSDPTDSISNSMDVSEQESSQVIADDTGSGSLNLLFIIVLSSAMFM